MVKDFVEERTEESINESVLSAPTLFVRVNNENINEQILRTISTRAQIIGLLLILIKNMF